MPRKLINPPPRMTFNQVYKMLAAQPEKQTPELMTAGGVPFVAEAKISPDGRRFISLPQGNRIYEEDWIYITNRMRHGDQRIGQYSWPLDEWAGSC